MNIKKIPVAEGTGYDLSYLLIDVELSYSTGFIDPNDVYDVPNYGIEDEYHVTILPNIDTSSIVPIEFIKRFCQEAPIPYILSAKKLTLFENEEFDVLKLDVDKIRPLVLANKWAVENCEWEDRYGTYHPHLTIAYLKPGTGKKYIRDSAVMFPTTGVRLTTPTMKYLIDIKELT